MYLGTIYLIVNDFNKSIDFYEKLLEMPVTSKNMNRFAKFIFEGHNISIMNGHFDAENPDKVVHKGEHSQTLDSLQSIALAPNTHKFVLNFLTEDLRSEYERVRELNITDYLTKIKYVYNVSPYYYFQLTDPDGNAIEVTGAYTEAEGEFD
ncbi:MAG: VOC family protein [Clostridiales bacterium]|jgi:lactoylglutathione lyase|nr:VOC family protein [Clostridiales bacterium]